MAACGLGALAGIGRTASIQTALLCAAALVYGILMLLIDRAWCRHNRVVAQAPQREG
jgi:hypothetical protein